MPVRALACIFVRAVCCFACERHLVRANLHLVESLFVRVTLAPSDTVRHRRDRTDALRLSGPCGC